MSSFWETVRHRLAADRAVFIALVVEHSVHSPGTTGARMAVFRDGSSLGTIGGGIMEFRVLENAESALQDSAYHPRIQRLVHRKEGAGEKSGLICAGFQTNLYVVMRAEQDLARMDQIVQAISDARPALISISQAGVGVIPDPQEAMRVQHALHLDGERWVYRESTINLSRIAILGGGHCGLALSRLMQPLGYHVTIFDTRSCVPTMVENDVCDRKHTIDDFLHAGRRVEMPERTDVVVMTTALSSDIRALAGLIGCPFPFVGVMGSRTKIAAIRKALADEEGGTALLERLVAPVGLPIGSNTPDEIAVSVAAQLLARRSERRAESDR